MKSRRRLSHVRPDGSVRMVDIGAKQTAARTGVAVAVVRMTPGAMRALRRGTSKKGDALTTEQIAGIAAAKKTADLIPLCHPLALTHAGVEISIEEAGVRIYATASTTAQTGV